MYIRHQILNFVIDSKGLESIQGYLENPASAEASSWSWSGGGNSAQEGLKAYENLYRKWFCHEEPSSLGSAHHLNLNKLGSQLV